MNKVSMMVLSVFLLGAGVAFAEDATQPAVQAKDEQPVEVGNKLCPVSHEEVGKNGMAPHKMVYKGKAYNLCCSMCVKDFNKDPDKYAKMAEDEVAKTKEATQGK